MPDLHDPHDREADLEPGRAEVRVVLALTAGPSGETIPPDIGDPQLQQIVERHRRVAVSLSKAGPATPPTLMTQLDLLTNTRGDSRPGGKRGVALRAGWRRRWVAVPVAVAAVVAAIAFAAGSSGTVAATRVADVWRLPASGSAVHPSSTHSGELDVTFHGTPYPAYRDGEGWHAVGSRRDEIGGKPAYTVFYATGARRAAYTVVAGTRVSIPASARRFVADGLRMAEFRDGDRWILVFRNRANSCVLTAAAPRERAWLVKLAAWHDGRTSTAAL